MHIQHLKKDLPKNDLLNIKNDLLKNIKNDLLMKDFTQELLKPKKNHSFNLLTFINDPCSNTFTCSICRYGQGNMLM